MLYPDGSINKYIYCSTTTCAQAEGGIINEFVTDENNNKILVSFIFLKDNINYIIDINGNLYKINVPELDEMIEKIEFDVIKINNINIGNIDYVEVSSYTKKTNL